MSGRPPRWAVLSVVLIAVQAAVPAQGQEDGTSTHLWMSYRHQHKVRERTRVFTSLGYEEQMSREDFWGEWNKIYLTAGGSYDLGERFRIAAGVGTHYSFFSSVDDLFELRLWQEGTAYWPDSPGRVRRWVLTHRLRLEERLTESDAWAFMLRLRYRLDTKTPLNSYTLEPGCAYIPLAGELFADLSGETAEYFSQKNRLSVGLGYVLNQSWTVELNFHREGSRATREEGFTVSSNVIDIKFKSSVRIRDFVMGR
jgi:hypothetical protein